MEVGWGKKKKDEREKVSWKLCWVYMTSYAQEEIEKEAE